MKINPLAGRPATAAQLIDVSKLITAYFMNRPDTHIPSQRIAFGTSGHRGSAFDTSFNEWHVLAMTQAVCLYRKLNKINGPLFLGMDT
ncbi:MAG: alpha-D-glucose phosphate-specific phosphoglucomutase, partial [Chitinophagaceae bacterium]|nr:alpha-D-glucose phosphate-specific phosphoglucomutase [Oligoflexus sp.]